MENDAGHYIADRKPVAPPVVASWSLYLAIRALDFVDSKERVRIMAALDELYLAAELRALSRKLGDEF